MKTLVSENKELKEEISSLKSSTVQVIQPTLQLINVKKKVNFKVDLRQREIELSIKAVVSENKELKEVISSLKSSTVQVIRPYLYLDVNS